MNHLEYSSILCCSCCCPFPFVPRFARWRLPERQVFPPHYTGNICISVYRLNIHEGSGVRKIREADTGTLWTYCPFLPFYALPLLLSFLFFPHPPLIFVSLVVCTMASLLPRQPRGLTWDSRNSQGDERETASALLAFLAPLSPFSPLFSSFVAARVSRSY